MKQSITRILVLAALTLGAVSAFATETQPQAVTTNLSNAGSIKNEVHTSAAVTGTGMSYSSATAASGASAGGSVTAIINPVDGVCVTKSGEVGFSGTASTYNNATAFNVSSGGGNGTASASGVAAASVAASTKYTGTGQSVSLTGSIGQNSSASVVAATNQGGFSNAANTGTFTGTGTVGSTQCKTGCGTNTTVTNTVWGTVDDTKSSTSQASAGAMTVDGVVLNTALTNNAATSSVVVNGSFADPI